MTRPRTTFPAVLLIVLVVATALRAADAPDPLAWPDTVSTSGPWTRWWWLGSAVDQPNLTRLLEQYKSAGIGGVEICPIYGAKGYEDRYLEFLSPRWTAMFAHTKSEARRLGIGVDLTTGTGWPFGGPQVTDQDASSKLVLSRFGVKAGTKAAVKLPAGHLQSLTAVPADGAAVDLMLHVRDQALDWTAPANQGDWRLYAATQSGPVQKVKRAAPGGEGNVLDPFSPPALTRYLESFDKGLAPSGAAGPTRAQFHDSFEYYNATWTTDFFDQFQARRHYDLRTQLPALSGDGPDDLVARVKYDYRQTIAELHTAYVQTWTDWAHRRDELTRDQAHGAPANLPDVYAASDIPETELQFGDVAERQIPMLKFSSSAAHVTGRPLASSESFTWLGEHFQVSLADVKPAADLFFLSGVNHIFFHGIPYSPQDVQWPGWLFYAAVNFGPQGGLWHDLPAFNAYVARCQSVLRAGQPDNDVLLYFPVHDLWESSRGMLIPMGVGDQNKWFWDQPVYKTAMALWKAGIGFDFASDAQLRRRRPDQPIVIPPCTYMPAATMTDLLAIAREGGTVIFEGTLPKDVPGLSDLGARRAQLAEATRAVQVPAGSGEATVGKGKVVVGGELLAALKNAGAHRETMAESGLRFIRRKSGDRERSYFVVNNSAKPIDGWVPLGVPARSVAILDPRFDARAGMAAVRQLASGLPEVYLQLEPGESRILRAFEDRTSGRTWAYAKSPGPANEVAGEWRVDFIEGGPKLPAATTTSKLASWTALGGDDARVFAGTARYTVEFDRPTSDADGWVLSLGRVCESARVKLNGNDLGTLWCAPFTISTDRMIRAGRNTLEIEVTNLAANRIADLDRRHVNWKSFHEINFVNRNYKPFDASGWPLRDSGLLGPIELIPMKALHPADDR